MTKQRGRLVCPPVPYITKTELEALRADLKEVAVALKACLHRMNHAYGGATNFAVPEKAKAQKALARPRVKALLEGAKDG